MLGRRKIKSDYRNIFTNEYRQKIWDLCKIKPRSFTELKKLLKISTGALDHHVRLMIKIKLLSKEEIRQGGKFKRGKEIKIIVNPNKFNELFKKEQEEERKYFNVIFPSKLKIKILKLLKENQPIKRSDFTKILIEKGYSLETETFLLTHLIYSRKIDEVLKLSEEGEQFLKQNGRPKK